tara:strand:+ start:28 stop:822 length:795 start_codon:yes stop_codon:yes gene_type:complete
MILILEKTLRLLKRFLIIKLINHFSKYRYSVNNFFGSSKEVSLLYEEYKTDLYDQQFLELIAQIYKNYSNDDKSFIEPRIISNYDKEKVWDQYIKRKTGEHYRLLITILKIIKSKKVLEVGTFRGASAKVMLENYPIEKIHTFDLIPWREFNGTFLEEKDFESGRINQYIDDLSKKDVFKKYNKEIIESDFIFIDGPKNYNFEKRFLKYLFDFIKYKKKGNTFILLDDVKVSTMCQIWRSIDYPKVILDLVGHWSGSGLIMVKN